MINKYVTIYIIYILFIMPFVAVNLSSYSHAEQLNNDLKANSNIEIEADDGIEWIKNNSEKTGKYHASGNVFAKRDGLTINSDDLTAYYKSNFNGKNQYIFRIDAIGHVKIITNDTVATGDKAVYYIDRQLAVIIGNNLKLKSPKITITANKSLEYWQKENIAVAKGGATVVQNNKHLRADSLTAFIGIDEETSEYNIKRINAIGDVHISNATEIIQAQEAVYNLNNQIATLCGKVKITRGQNQLNGQCAEINMKTGNSKIKGGRGKVKGLIIPLQ